VQVPRPLLAARSLIDGAARHSPARLAVTTFAGVIAVFTALHTGERGDGESRW